MKKMVTTILLTALFFTLKAPALNVTYMIRPAEVNYYSRLINAITTVESQNNNLAFNFKESARGPFQIRPIRLREYNYRTGKNYQEWDCYNFDISKEIFLYYTKGRSYEVIARCWCSGEAGTKKASEGYWLKVQDVLKNKLQ